MKIIPHQNIASSVITVTSTATALFTLIDTAGSVTTSMKYFTSPSLNSTGVANGVLITPEDGDIRLGYGVVPTAALGMLLDNGTKYFIPGVDIEDVQLIRTSGDVSCSVEIAVAESDEVMTAVAGSSSAAASVNVSQLGGVNIDLGAGAVAGGTQRTTLASDDPAVALLTTIDADTSSLITPIATISATPLQRVAIFDASDAQITSFGGGTEYTQDAIAPANPVGKANVMERDDALGGVTPAEGDFVGQLCNANGALWTTLDGALPAGTNAIGKLSANSGVDIGDVDVTSISAGTNIIGQVMPAASTNATGATAFWDADGDNTAQVMKAGAGNLYKVVVFNPNAAQGFIQFFDTAAGSVTVGTTTPVYVLPVPANDGTSDSGVIDDHTIPLGFSTAITYACTTTPTGAGDPAVGLRVSATYV